MNRLALFILFSISCGRTPELVVVVGSDLIVPDELALVRAVVKDASGKPTSVNDFLLEANAAPSLPFSFVIIPADGDASREIVLELSALDRGRQRLFERRARTGFLANRTLLLDMFLPASCRSMVCADGETCSEVGCVSDRVAPEDLREVEPGEEI